MTAAVARVATEADHPLMVRYAAHCQDLVDARGITDRARRDRLRLARRFLEQHPDLDRWMARPAGARLTDLARIKAWPLLSFAILTGRLTVDLDLLLAKDLGGFGHTAEMLFPDDYAPARGIAAQLGWSPRWTLDVLHECLPLVLAVAAVPMRSLTLADLDRFAEDLRASTVVTASSRRAYHSRLFGLRQLLFEARIVDAAPTRCRSAATFAGRLGAVPAPEIRRVMLHYLDARSAVLRPASLSSICDALVVFGEYLGEQHPHLVSLRQLERGHVEGFLTANATLRWRGRVARDQRAGRLVGQSARNGDLHRRVPGPPGRDDAAAWGMAGGRGDEAGM